MHPSLAYLPSPRDGVWHLGPIPIRAYALCIIAGIIAAVWIGERRWVARGGRRGTVSDIAVWAVIFGLVGGRLYHVITDPELYFGSGRHPLDAFKVWQGGLGIWGAISLGGVGAWIGCRRRGIKLPPYADATAPGIAVAQAIGRWGNWFNQELFGRPTTLPWGVKIDPGRPSTVPGAVAYQPTFLYESLWDLGLAGALVLVDRRFKLGRGRVFALYAMGYTAGRVWIEALRIDTANHVLGLRVNIWTSIIVFTGALIYFLRHPGPRETEVEPATAAPAAAGTAAEEAEPAAEAPAAEALATEAEAPSEVAATVDAAEPETATELATAVEPGSAAPDAEAEAEPAVEPGATATPEADAEPPATPLAEAEPAVEPGVAAEPAAATEPAAAEPPAGTSRPAPQPRPEADQAAPSESTAGGGSSAATPDAAAADDGAAAPGDDASGGGTSGNDAAPAGAATAEAEEEADHRTGVGSVRGDES